MLRRLALIAGIVVAAIAGALVWQGCSRPPVRVAGPVRVVVTIPPLAGLIKPMLPADANVTVLISPGRSEHGYEFTARDIAAMAKADMVFYVGLGLETQVEAYLRDHPSKGRLDLAFAESVGIRGATETHDDHAHEHEEEHAHAGPDPHLWLDPALVERLIPKLKEAVLAAIKGAGAAESGPAVEAAAAKLLTDVQTVDAESRARLAPFAGRAIVTHHAAWSRFAEHFGLKVAAVIRPIETSEPTPETINKTVAAIREQSVTAIFVEPQFNAAAAERLSKEAGVKLGTLDPLGNGDWFKMMRDNVDAVVRAFGP